MELNLLHGLSKSKVRFDLENRKTLASASLISFLILVTLSNQSLLSQKETPAYEGRTLASIGRTIQIDPVQTEWERRLAAELAQSGHRKLASLGQQPNPYDELRFGLLEGKYAFRFQEGKIQEIEFANVASSNDRPKYLTESGNFLRDHRSLFAVDFQQVRKIGTEDKEGFRIERFDLVAAGEAIAGRAEVATDQYGRLISVRLSHNQNQK